MWNQYSRCGNRACILSIFSTKAERGSAITGHRAVDILLTLKLSCQNLHF